MKASEGREQRTVFGEVAELYDQARPGYPDALLDDVLEFVGRDSPKVLEVGAGTGKATVLLALRGLEIVAVEPSAEMAAVARRHCAPFPMVSIQVQSFEACSAATGTFDLLASAQAWHWVRPEVRYRKAHRVLTPEGVLAVFWNRPLWEDSVLRAELDEIYESRAPELRAREPGFPGLTQPHADEERAEEIEASSLFGPATERSYRWSKTYSMPEYLQLLQTQSDHRMLPDPERDSLLTGVAEVIGRAGGRLTMDYLSRLYLARRK
jgi:SAM-dependent methyltransferase